MANDFKRGIRVYLETSDYGKGIESMVAATKKYEAELSRLTEESKKMTAAGQNSGKAWDDLQKQLKAHEKQLIKSQAAEADYRAKLQQTEKVLNNLSGVSYNELLAVQKQLQKEVKATTRGTEEHRVKLQQLDKVNKEVSKSQAEMNSNLGKNQGFFGRAADGFNRYFNVAITFIAGITGVSMAFRKLAEDVAKMDDVYSDVMKTTGMVKEEVIALNAEFKKMDTRTSREDLNKLAEEAGKLGIEGTKNILDFVDAGNQIKVALGEDLGEDAIKNVGKMVGVFENSTRQLQGIGLKEQMLAVGSAINQLGASSSASEDYLVQFAGRLGGVSKQAKISMADILGYASSLDQDMQQVEMSATALQQFIMKLMGDPAKFAKLAGLEVKAFSNLLNTDTNAAIKQVLRALNEKGGFQALIPIFQEMGLDGARATGVLSSMAGSIEKIDEAQRVANQSMTEGVSITKEYDTKNNNLAAKLDKAKKSFFEISLELGASLNPFLLKSVNATTYLIKALVELPKWLKNNWQWLATIAISITAYTIAIKAATIATATSVAWTKLQTAWTNRAAIAQTVLNFVISKNPIAFVITLIAGLVAAFITWYNSSLKVQAVMQGIFASMKVMGSKLLAYWTGLWQLISGAVTLNPKQLKKSIESFKKAFTGWGDDLAKAYTDAYNKRMAQGVIKTPTKPGTKPDKNGNPTPDPIITPTFTPTDEDSSDPYDKELKRKEIKYKELQLELMELRRIGSVTEDEYNKKAINQQLMFLQEKMNLQLKYKKETIDTEIEISTQKIKLQEDADKAILKSIQDLQDAGNIALETGNQTKQNMLQDSLNQQVITEKEYNREIKKLAVEMLAAKIALAEASIKALETADFADKAVKDAAIKKANDDLLKMKGDLLKAQGDVAKDTAKEIEDNTKTVAERMEGIFGNSFSNIGKMFTSFTESLNKLKAGDLKSWTDWGTAIGGIIQTSLAVATEINDQYFEYKAASLEADKQRELTNAGDNAEARDAINQKYAQKELDLKKKQSSADTFLKVAQAVAAGGLAIVQAFAQLGPIGGAIAAVLIGGITGFQIASILKQNKAIQATTLDSSASGGGGSSAPTKTGARIATPQAAEGRWDVMGADDGRTYRNVPYRGVARTGIVTTPTLVGEVGDELIVDNPTLRNIRMNAPGVLSTIKRMRVNQRADGNYSNVDSSAPAGSGQGETNALYSLLLEMIGKNNALLAYLAENGVDTVFVLDEFEKLKALRDKSRAKGSL